MRNIVWAITFIVFVIVLLSETIKLSPGTDAQDKSYFIDGYNVEIHVNSDASVKVYETINYMFTKGNFHYCYRYIPLRDLDDIYAVKIAENGQDYTRNENVRKWIKAWKKDEVIEGMDNSYTTWTDKDNFHIAWWFPKTANSQRSFELSYQVRGAIHESSHSPRLFWSAVFKNHKEQIKNCIVTVFTPQIEKISWLYVNKKGKNVPYEKGEYGNVYFAETDFLPDEYLDITVDLPSNVINGELFHGDNRYIPIRFILLFAAVIFSFVYELYQGFFHGDWSAFANNRRTIAGGGGGGSGGGGGGGAG